MMTLARKTVKFPGTTKRFSLSVFELARFDEQRFHSTKYAGYKTVGILMRNS